MMMIGVMCVAAACAMAEPPASPKKPVTDTYHGTKVTDDYRWLENWDAPEVKAWSEAQNKTTREALDGFAGRAAIKARMQALLAESGSHYDHLAYKSGKLFSLKTQPPRQQPFLVQLPSIDSIDGEQVVFDPAEFDKTGSTTIDWFFVSPNGALIAMSLSKGGSESGDVYVYDTVAKKLSKDVVPRVNGGTAGGSLAWMPDSSGFFYTRYPRDTDTPKRAAEDMDFFQQVYSHKLGDDAAKDKYEVGREFPRIAEVQFQSGGDWLACNVQKGDGGEFEAFLRSPSGQWTKLTNYADKAVHLVFGGGKEPALFIASRKDAPNGKVLRLDLKTDRTPSLADARQIVAEQKDASIETDFADQGGLTATIGRLYVTYQVGGPNEVRVFDLAGAPIGPIKGEPISSYGDVTPYKSDDVLVRTQSFITPPAWQVYSAAKSTLTPTNLKESSAADFSDCEVVREFAVSKDGTKVPVNIIKKKGAKGPVPTVLWGYGGYGINQGPTFSPRRRWFIEQGGAFAVANIRGGGEYGEAWHLQGNLTRKQNVFDDFYAAAKHLVDKGYTNPQKLCLMGGSNGGLLMGALITQHPEISRCVVSSVGIYDMLRVELSPNGAFNITEFGTVTNPDHFKALFAYSPYHNVKDGTSYPAVLFPTGANDPRVDPMQSRKMVARLQAADPKGTFLLRTSANTGHGAGTPLNAQVELQTDIYAFIAGQLGMSVK